MHMHAYCILAYARILYIVRIRKYMPNFVPFKYGLIMKSECNCGLPRLISNLPLATEPRLATFGTTNWKFVNTCLTQIYVYIVYL